MITISREKINVDKIRELPDPIKAVAMDGVFVCAALSKSYVMFNVASGKAEELFPYDDRDTIPIVARISKVNKPDLVFEKDQQIAFILQEEFLVNAPGGLGMCITAEGISERPPIPWSNPVAKIVYCHPYIITLTSENDSIVIYR